MAWGLRDYKLPPVVWDGVEGCEHEWQETQIKRAGRDDVFYGGKEIYSQESVEPRKPIPSNFCSKCSAWKGQLGLEPTFQLYVKHIVEIFHEVKRVLKPTGSLYINLGDTYSGSGGAGGDYDDGGLKEGQPRYSQGNSTLPAKCLIGIPERVMLAMVDDGWILRNKIIWYKPNHMPSSVKDRFSNGYEFVYFFVKQGRYYFDLDAVREAHRTTREEFIAKGTIRTYKKRGGGTSLDSGFKFKNGGFRDYVAKHGAEPNPSGKNPGDVIEIEIKTRNANEAFFERPPTNYYKMGENPLGKNPSDYWEITTQPFSGAALVGDYVGTDGKVYIASPNCPIHWQFSRRQSSQTERRGGQPSLESNHSLSIGSHPSSARAYGQKPSSPLGIQDAPPSKTDSQNQNTAQNQKSRGIGASKNENEVSGEGLYAAAQNLSHTSRTEDLPKHLGQSSDSPPLSDSQTATLRSIGNHKTFSEIEQHGSVSEGTASRIPDTRQEFSSEPHQRNTYESKSVEDSLLGAQSGQTLPRIGGMKTARRKGCVCEIISVDHFAVFPEKLVERPIKASCPAEICAKCGKARERIIEPTKEYAKLLNQSWMGTTKIEGKNRPYTGFHGARKELSGRSNPSVIAQYRTLGWTECSCPEKSYRAGIVLDPFAGSGTVALVAKNLQRSSISIELKPEYIQMLKRRIDFGSPTIDSGIEWVELAI